MYVLFRYANNGIESSSQEYTKIQQKPQPTEIKKEKPDLSQVNITLPSRRQQQQRELALINAIAHSR